MNRCYTESDVIAELRGWNEMSGDNDVVCVLWICVVVGTESYVCDQLPKLPEEPPPIGDCIILTLRVESCLPGVQNLSQLNGRARAILGPWIGSR